MRGILPQSFLVLVGSTLADELLCLSKILCGELALNVYEALYKRLILLEHLVVALGDRSRDDKRSTCVVDKHRVDLIDNGVVVLALHEVGRRDCHVVAKVVETELVVRTECDVCHVSLAALRRVGTVLVDTVDRESVEHIERAHPLRVALCEVVVDGYDVNAVAGKSVEEYRECRHESLTLTGSHLRNLALVQYDTAEELYVVVNHFHFRSLPPAVQWL